MRSELALSSVDDMIYVANVRSVLNQSNAFIKINSRSRSRSEALVRVPDRFSERDLINP